MSADLAVPAVECARTVIAQINRAMPYSYGDARIHVSRLAAAVEVDDPLVEVPSVVPSETERRIGNYIAELIPDGATLQIGVGGIPNAVLAALEGHKHLGLHTEAMTDGVLPLIEKGVIDNSQKRVLPGMNVASLALGSRRLYDYMDYRKELVMKDVAWTNDPFRIRQNPKVMAINSAVEVDLTGQVCADSVGTRIISGVGGQHDFMYGGALSEGGKTFIAIPSTTPRGESKIRALLAPGAGVVTTRHMVQHIVTEYGVAQLRGRNLAERARALIDIAHPSVREEPEREAAKRYGAVRRMSGPRIRVPSPRTRTAAAPRSGIRRPAGSVQSIGSIRPAGPRNRPCRIRTKRGDRRCVGPLVRFLPETFLPGRRYRTNRSSSSRRPAPA